MILAEFAETVIDYTNTHIHARACRQARTRRHTHTHTENETKRLCKDRKQKQNKETVRSAEITKTLTEIFQRWQVSHQSIFIATDIESNEKEKGEKGKERKTENAQQQQPFTKLKRSNKTTDDNRSLYTSHESPVCVRFVSLLTFSLCMYYIIHTAFSDVSFHSASTRQGYKRTTFDLSKDDLRQNSTNSPSDQQKVKYII